MIPRLAAALCVSATLAGAPALAADPPPDATHSTCVDVTAGSAQSYACLNAQLAIAAAQQHRASSATDAPVSATSPGNVTGTFNESATRNRLGAGFGHSVVPERPR